MFKILSDSLITRKGQSIEVRTADGSLQESSSVESNLLFEILQQLKKGSK